MTSLRISAGTLRGRRVPVPRSDVRPTSERARQAFFDIIGDRISGARFLDLFAGSGIFSFEAVSRGAEMAVAVDSTRVSTAAIERLSEALAVPVRTITADVLAGIERLRGEVFDVTWVDPPYEWNHYDDLLAAIDTGVTLAPGAIVAIEHRRNTDPFRRAESPPLHHLRFSRRAEYGEVWISFFIE